MKKTFIKTVFKDLWKNLSRFLAIIAIVALGVGFLIGLLSSTPDLRYSLDCYYDEQNVYDINIKSTIGFDDKDIASLKNDLNEVWEIDSHYQIDMQGTYDNKDIVLRLECRDFNKTINKLTLVKGRLPKSRGECVILNKGIFLNQDVLGKVISAEEDYTIVGVVESAIYYYKLSEPTNIGTGNLDAIIYTDELYYDNLFKTDINITILNAQAENTFKKSYFEKIDPVVKHLIILKQSYLESRKTSLFNTYVEEIYPIISEKYIKEIKLKLETMGIPKEMHQSYLDNTLKSLEGEIQSKVIEEANNEIAKLTMDWYILDRKSNISYLLFYENSGKVDDVSVVFPFFFFFIAVLISLTSITRMVSEDRSSIGTLKSLGYANHTILLKYLFYAIFACLIGCLLGVVCGVYLLPIVIYSCYDTLFVLPKGYYLWDGFIIGFSCLAMVLTILLVMLVLCLKTLHEKPNSLLVPKAPKAGKRILLERIKFIWNKLSFKYKSALRNVFRFKRNLVMMVVGIGGCSALMLVAFCLQKSMNSFSKIQYDDIIKYDLIVDSKEDLAFSMLSDSDTYSLLRYEGYVANNKEYTVDLIYADEKILDYVNLNVGSFNEKSCVISSQLSHQFHLTKGSKIILEIDGELLEFKITEIFNNHLKNYVFVHKSLVENVEKNSYLVKLGTNDKERSDEIVKILNADNKITKVENISQTRKNYDSMSNNIGLIIYVVIFFSGALTAVVIYNLTNINISERIKEIATLKVLGYQKSEVLAYIFREILFMSILGILFGFILGPILEFFIMSCISSPGMYLPTIVSWQYFLYTFILTLAFVLIVLLLFIPQLKKIEMVESLKCVE